MYCWIWQFSSVQNFIKTYKTREGTCTFCMHLHSPSLSPSLSLSQEKIFWHCINRSAFLVGVWFTDRSYLLPVDGCLLFPPLFHLLLGHHMFHYLCPRLVGATVLVVLGLSVSNCMHLCLYKVGPSNVPHLPYYELGKLVHVLNNEKRQQKYVGQRTTTYTLVQLRVVAAKVQCWCNARWNQIPSVLYHISTCTHVEWGVNWCKHIYACRYTPEEGKHDITSWQQLERSDDNRGARIMDGS